MKLSKVVFEFQEENHYLSAVWYPKGSDGYSGYAALDGEVGRKYEVSIFRGGGYKCSYYTDHAANKSNSIEFINKYLQNNNAKSNNQ